MELINIRWPQLQVGMCANLFQVLERDLSSLPLLLVTINFIALF